MAGDDLGGGPVAVVGDQDVLAEDLLFQRGAPGHVDGPGQPQVAGGIPGQLPGDDAADPGVMGDLGDLRFDRGPGRRVLPRAKVAASSPSCLVALASVVQSKPRA